MNYRIQTIVDAIPPGAKVLDIGAAKVEPEFENFAHHHIAERADYCVGIDINQDAIDALPKYNIRHANAESFDFDETFDVVVAGEVIEHLSHPGRMLDRVRGHLRARGKFICSTPYPWMFLKFREALFDYPGVFEDHVAWYCPRTLSTLLARHGFDVDEIHLTKPKHIGISWLCFEAGLERLGAPGFVTVARRSNTPPAAQSEVAG